MPDPADVLSYNRFLYTRANPLKYTDPTGHEECTAGDNWCWTNRWYNVRGYYPGPGGHWSIVGDPFFLTEAALNEAMADAGVGWAAESGLAWTVDWKTKVAGGVIKFAQAFAGGANVGLGKLRNLVGGAAIMHLRQNVSGICNDDVPCAVDMEAPYEVTWPVAFFSQQRHWCWSHSRPRVGARD